MIVIEMFQETVKDTKVNAKITGKRHNQIGQAAPVAGTNVPRKSYSVLNNFAVAV